MEPLNVKQVFPSVLIGDPMLPGNRIALFDLLVAQYMQQRSLEYAQCNRHPSGYIHYSFEDMNGWSAARYRKAAEELKGHIKEYGWEITDKARANLVSLFGSGSGNISKMWNTISYSPDRNSISIQIFETGYVMSHFKQRIFALRKVTPLLCVSKQLYAFRKVGRRWQPRIYTGMNFTPRIASALVTILKCAHDCIETPLSYKHMKGAKGKLQVYLNKFGDPLRYLIDHQLINGDTIASVYSLLEKDEKDFEEFMRRLAIMHEQDEIYSVNYGGTNFTHAKYKHARRVYTKHDPFQVYADIISSIMETGYGTHIKEEFDLPF